ncbi:MAG: hypothetical protein V1934_03980 [Methanobacteriota archaeon]
MVRTVKVRTGVMMMLVGFLMFALGVATLGDMSPDDPRWLVMAVTIITWLNVFVVIAGMAFLAEGAMIRSVARQFGDDKLEE